MNDKPGICSQCVMDTSDPEIVFNEKGICNHCIDYDKLVKHFVFSGSEGDRLLKSMVDEIRNVGRKNDYDCIIGVSGGVDSTYVAYTVKKLGLRPLAVHLDNGWDSELAVKNIENTLRKLGIELFTHVINWEEFKDLQLAFLRASTPDAEVPSDHAIFSIMYQMASRFNIKYVIRGLNIRTETHLPKAWSQGHMDWKYIKSVHKKFGSVKLKTFPHLTFFKYNKSRLSQKWFNILDFIDYNKSAAVKILEKELEWKNYGGKHYESIYTRFYQGYILPKKFGFDKRKSHFSSLICSGELTRDKALKKLENVTYPEDLQEADREYVIKKLGLTNNEFNTIMSLPPKSYWDYPSYGKTITYKTARYLYNFWKYRK